MPLRGAARRAADAPGRGENEGGNVKLRGLALAALIACTGCAASQPAQEPKPDPVGGTGIPITPEPDISLPPGHKWTPYLRGASCIVVPSADEKVKDDELAAFASEFEKHFFGKDSPFVKINENVMAKAAKRRDVMSSLPIAAGLTEVANQEGKDFAVFPKLILNVRPRSDTGRTDVDAEIIASGEVTLAGSAKKGARSLPTGTIDHNQLTSMTRQREMRLAHARVLGKLVGLSMLRQLATELSEAASENWIYLTFQKFSNADKDRIRDEILPDIEGVDPENGIEEMSAMESSGQFTIKVRTATAVNIIQREVTAFLKEQGWRIASSRGSGVDGNEQIIFVRQ